MDASGLEPDGLLVDYHLDGGNGIAAIAELRRRFGRMCRRLIYRRPLNCAGARKPRPKASLSCTPLEAGVLARTDHPVARATGGGGAVSPPPLSRRRMEGHWPALILPAAITACAGLSTPSLCKIAETCAFTVASTRRARAICLLSRPPDAPSHANLLRRQARSRAIRAVVSASVSRARSTRRRRYFAGEHRRDVPRMASMPSVFGMEPRRRIPCSDGSPAVVVRRYDDDREAREICA